MKSITFIIFLLVIFNASLFSQPLKSYGLKLGTTMSTQTWTNSKSSIFETQYRFGPAAGVFLESFSISQFSMFWELWYVQKGFTTHSENISLPTQIDALSPQLDYASMQFLLKYRMESEFLTYYLIAGPRLEVLANINSKGLEAFDLAHSYGDSDIGITAGFGILVREGFFKNVLGEIRYNPSLIPSYKNDTLTVVNNAFEIVIGISF